MLVKKAVNDNKKTVIVLGLACSGTSVLAGMLHYLGVNMNPVDNKVQGYPYGAFEDPEIQELTRFMSDKNIMKKHHLNDRKLKIRVKNIIKQRSSVSDIWGWKSALTYKCLDYFMPYIKNPYFVVIFRNILDNAESLKGLFATNYGQNLTFMASIDLITKELGNLCDAIKKYAKHPIFFTTFEGLKINFLGTCIGLANFLEIEPDFSAFERLSILYVDEKTRHGQKL